ncbi:MAG: LysM peptidoglycan-binding domain-containing protein [Anaerolineae bacterium]|nr:LysM peptidoglycan-binding domain-containing protein [Anaerolineae bacterium]
MRCKSIPALSLVLLLLCLTMGALSAQDEASDLFARVNNLRASVGRASYSYNAALAAAAQNQAQWMLETGSVSHTRPDGSGPRTRALNAGYPSTMVGENIYIGGMASADSAWTFWVNSGVHYAGMVNASFTEMGVGVAHGANGAAYVLVFGNSGGPPPPPPSSSGAAAVAAAADAPAQQGPPVYFAGVDGSGNLMHMVQAGDTLGDIALIYGYTWDDLPRLMALNNLADVRDLDIGSIFLVPSHAGTYTPSPGGPSETPPPPTSPPNTPTPIPPSITPYVAFRPVSNPATLVVTPLDALTQAASLSPTPSPTRGNIATAAAVPTELAVAMAVTPTIGAGASPSPAGTEIAQLPELEPAVQPASGGGAPPNTWLIVAIVVQAGVVLAAGFEFIRRAGKRRR